MHDNPFQVPHNTLLMESANGPGLTFLFWVAVPGHFSEHTIEINLGKKQFQNTKIQTDSFTIKYFREVFVYTVK